MTNLDLTEETEVFGLDYILSQDLMGRSWRETEREKEREEEREDGEKS